MYKEIIGFEGRYAVSPKGEVVSLRDNHGKLRDVPKVLKHVSIGHKPNNLYPAVNLYGNDGVRQCSVHRLVALTFLPNPDNLPLINHIDENTFNPCVTNLEWCTHQHNQQHSLSKRTYSFVDPDGNVINVINVRKFARDRGLNHAHLYSLANQKLKTYKGWRLFNEI